MEYRRGEKHMGIILSHLSSSHQKLWVTKEQPHGKVCSQLSFMGFVLLSGRLALLLSSSQGKGSGVSGV